MLTTVKDIEEQVKSNLFVRIAMNNAVKKLKNAEKSVGREIVESMIRGERKLNAEEYKIAAEKYGVGGLGAIEAMECLNPAQKEYLLKRMGYE